MIGRRTRKDDVVSAMILFYLIALVVLQAEALFKTTRHISNPDVSYSDNL